MNDIDFDKYSEQSIHFFSRHVPALRDGSVDIAISLWRPIKDVQRIFLKSSNAWLEAFALPIPRYRSIEILAQRVNNDSVQGLQNSQSSYQR